MGAKKGRDVVRNVSLSLVQGKMKIEKILEYEAQNNDTVILFKEGIFLRAYERSAMRFTEHIAPFKVFKKFYKIVNAEVCYLGFPMKSVRMLFQKVNITRFADMAEFMVVYGCPSKENFEVWKAGVQLPTAEDMKPETLLRPNVSKKDLKNIQIYKMGYDLMVELYRYAETMPKVHRYTVGERVRSEAIELSVVTYRIGQDRDVAENKRKAVECIEIIRLMLRMLVDLKQISLPYFTSLNVKIEHLYKQLL